MQMQLKNVLAQHKGQAVLTWSQNTLTTRRCLKGLGEGPQVGGRRTRSNSPPSAATLSRVRHLLSDNASVDVRSGRTALSFEPAADKISAVPLNFI